MARSSPPIHRWSRQEETREEPHWLRGSGWAWKVQEWEDQYPVSSQSETTGTQGLVCCCFDPPPSLDGLGGRPSAPQVASHRGRCVGCVCVCLCGGRRARRGYGPGRHSGHVPRRGQGCGRPFVHLLQAGVPRHHVEAPPRAGGGWWSWCTVVS